jgi:hypothetical protein
MEPFRNTGLDHRGGDFPELHPVDYEWYFTGEVATALGQLRSPGRVVCLGTPTIADRLLSVGVDAILIDRNPLVLRRFVNIRSREALLCEDLNQVRPTLPSAGTVYLDPPWYLDEFTWWLWHASHCVARGGTLVFPLFCDALRPAARDERANLLDLAARVGDVSIFPSQVEYETPKFEYEAGSAAGEPVGTRTADLVTVSVKRPGLPRPLVRPQEPTWDTYLVGPQVVKVRRTIDFDGSGPYLEEIPTSVGFVLPSVSRRWPGRDMVDIWTSRNRVARIHGRVAVLDALLAIQSGQTRPDSVSEMVRSFLGVY